MDLIAAFQIGYAFRLGYEYAHRSHIACLINVKAIANDAEFKEGEHPRDKDGKFKAGSGTVKEITDFNHEKYAKIASTETINAILAKYPQHKITDKVRNKQEEYQNKISALINKQKPKVKTLINQITLNPKGLTELPAIPHSVAKKLGIKPKKILLPLEVQLRTYSRHPDISPENLKYGLGLSLYGDGARVYDRNKRETYLHFTYEVSPNTKNDVVIEVREKSDAYEIIHFMKKVRRKQKATEKGERADVYIIQPSPSELDEYLYIQRFEQFARISDIHLG